MKIAVCVGHHQAKQGAKNQKHGYTEFMVMRELAPIVAELLREKGHEVEVIEGELTHKIERVNAGGFDLALDLHLNALDTKHRGCMVMYVPGNDERREQADAMSFMMAQYLGELNRGGREGWYWGAGLVEGNPTIKDAFLERTNCAAFIPEPFFIDYDQSVEKWLVSGRFMMVAEAIVFGIEAMEV